MKKFRAGAKIRPCPRCEDPVRYLKGKSDVNGRFGRQREGWHWVNAADNSHHRCADFMETGQEMNQRDDSFYEGALAAQWREAMERDGYREAGLISPRGESEAA